MAVQKAHRQKSEKATKTRKSVGHMQKCSTTICSLEMEMRWRFNAKDKGDLGKLVVREVVDVDVTDVQDVVDVDVQDDGDGDDETAPHCWLLQLL